LTNKATETQRQKENDEDTGTQIETTLTLCQSTDNYHTNNSRNNQCSAARSRNPQPQQRRIRHTLTVHPLQREREATHAYSTSARRHCRFVLSTQAAFDLSHGHKHTTLVLSHAWLISIRSSYSYRDYTKQPNANDFADFAPNSFALRITFASLTTIHQQLEPSCIQQ